MTTSVHSRDGAQDDNARSPSAPTDRELARRRALELASKLAISGPLVAVLLDPTRADAYSNGSGDEGDLDP